MDFTLCSLFDRPVIHFQIQTDKINNMKFIVNLYYTKQLLVMDEKQQQNVFFFLNHMQTMQT